MASIEACGPVMPLSMLWAAPSTTMMASSTTMPIASTIANKVAKVDREAKRPHGGEGADDRHRHRGRRHQHGAPVLQEHQDDDEHQDGGFEQRLVDLVDRGLDEHRGVEGDRIGQAGREVLLERRHALRHLVGDVERVGAGREEDRKARGRLVVELEVLAVGLRPELDPADVADARQLAVRAGLDHDVGELGGGVEAAGDVERVLERHVGRRRRRADLPRGDLHVLLLEGVGDVRHRQPARLHLLRIKPDAHGVFASAEYGDVADAGQSRNLVLEIDRRVVRHIEAVVALVRRGQRDDLQDGGGLLLHRHALRLHRVGQRGECRRHAVLHQDLREVQVGADLEGDGQRIGAVGRGVGLHVDHAVDAVDFLLDRQRHRVDDGLGAGAGIARGHLHGRRHHIGILRDGQAEHGHAADDDDQNRDDVGEDRSLDEEFRDHGAAVTFRPCAARPSDPAPRA